MSIPACASMISYTLVGLVDTVMVGHLGAGALAAVGLSHTLVFVAGALMIGFLQAVNPLVAQNVGAGAHRAVGHILHQATWISLIGGALVGMLLWFGAEPALLALDQEPVVVEIGSEYMRMRALGLPLLFLTVTRDGFFEGLGDTRTPMVLSLVVNVFHIFLNVWFIHGGFGLPAMGPAGAAISTVFAHGLGAVLSHQVLLRLHRQQPGWGVFPLSGWSWEWMRRLAEVGVPTSVQFTLDVASWGLLSVGMSRFGAVAMAASQIVFRLVNVATMAAHGVGIATTSIVGQELGARRRGEARAYAGASLKLALLWSLVVCVVYAAAPRAWMGLFTDDPAVVEVGVDLLMVGLSVVVFDTLLVVAYGVLRGAGDTKFSMWVLIAVAWLVAPPVAWVLAFELGWGPVGILLGLATQCLAGLLFFAARLMGERWMNHDLVAEQPAPAIEEPAAPVQGQIVAAA